MIKHLVHSAALTRTTPPPRRETEYELFMRLADEHRRANRRQRRRESLRRIRRPGRRRG